MHRFAPPPDDPHTLGLSALRLCDAFDAALDPMTADDAVALNAVAAYTHRVEGPAPDVATLPEQHLEAARAAGVFELLIPAEQGGALRWSRTARATSRLAAYDLGTTLVLGGTMLATIPVWLAGSDEQKRRAFACLRDGKLAGLGLSEWASGSDLSATQCTATPRPDGGFTLSGVKAPINNGSAGAWVVVLARMAGTSGAEATFGSTLFWIPRETPGLRAHPRVDWLGHAAMDLSGIELHDATLGAEHVLGSPNEGFVLTRRTLEISRSGVAAMSVGLAAQALTQALVHARGRRLYGAPIAEILAVQQTLGLAAAKLASAWALVREATRAVDAARPDAKAWTCAAKLYAPRVLEQLVALCGTVLGARSLLSAHPFSAVRRNAPLFAIFDGSAELQRDELWRYAATWRDADSEREKAIVEAARQARGASQLARFAASDAALVLYIRAALARAPRGDLAQAAARLGGEILEDAPGDATIARAWQWLEAAL